MVAGGIGIAGRLRRSARAERERYSELSVGMELAPVWRWFV